MLPTSSPNLVRTYPAHHVTTIGGREVSPQDVGLSAEDVDAIWGRVVALYESGIVPGLALSVRHKGEVVIDRAIGHARGNGPRDHADAAKIKATPGTLFNVYSTSKSVTAMVIHLLDDRGLLHLDDAVEVYIPEFGRNGKEWITVRHVLTHRAGIPTVPGEAVDLDLLLDPDEIIRRLCDAEPQSRAGARLAYHALTGGFVLGEIVRRVTGKGIREFLRDEVVEPLGFDHFLYGVPPELLGEVAVDSFTGPTPPFPASYVVKRALGAPLPEAVEVGNDERYVTGVVPAGNVFATADDVCRFFELLRCGGELDGVRIFDERTVRRAVSEQSFYELDTTLMLPLRYGMGFILGGKRLSFYGPDSGRAFGHLGFTTTLGYADPARDLSVGLVTNGKPLLTAKLMKWFAIMREIAVRVPRGG